MVPAHYGVLPTIHLTYTPDAYERHGAFSFDQSTLGFLCVRHGDEMSLKRL